MAIDKRVDWYKPLPSPRELRQEIVWWDEISGDIEVRRTEVANIIHWRDQTLLTVVWPCSLHDVDEALEYAEWLKKIKFDFPNLKIVMRAYFEKPRTTIWWKGLINDPNLDWTFDVEMWLRKARRLLLDINRLDIATATELLDPLVSQYIADLISWSAIWARTTQSPTHREMASGLSMPVWFKNWTDWSPQIAIDALKSSQSQHSFLWINEDWMASIVDTRWNPDWHIILRWWDWMTNYSPEQIAEITRKLEEAWVNPNLMVDFSHANSHKNHEEQIFVARSVAKQIAEWNTRIMWVMIESNLEGWNQPFTPGKTRREDLKRGVSITDKCVWLEQTQEILWLLDHAVWKRKERSN